MRFGKFPRSLRAAVLPLMLAASPALGHSEGDMGKPQHGGQFILDEWHRGAELVVKGQTIVFHMTEHLEPADQTGASYTAVVELEGKKTEVPLKLDGSTATGSLPAALPGGAVVILQGLDSSGAAFVARFETK